MSNEEPKREEEKKEEEKKEVKKKEEEKIVYQFNDEIGDFEELIIDADIELKDLLKILYILLTQ